MKNKNGKALVLLFFCIAILAIFIAVYFVNSKKEDENNNIKNTKNKDGDIVDVYKENKVEETKYKEFKFSTAYGEIKITAEKAYSARGTAGASSIIFYLKDSKLYQYNNNGRDEIYADCVEDIYYTSDKDETLKVKLNGNSNINKETPYISYEK